MPLFAIIYEPGPAWRSGKPIREQPLDEHTAYQRDLHRQGRSQLAGPFLDEQSGGLAVVHAADESAARGIAENDPAVIQGVFVARVRPWFAMMDAEARANVDVIRRLFAAVESRDQIADVASQWAQYERLYDPAVVIHEAPSLPYGGEYRGAQGVAEHAAGFRAAWDALQTDDERRLEPQFAAHADRVFVLWEHRAHDPKTHETLRMPVVSVYTLRERRIVASRMFHFDAAASRAFAVGRKAQT